jgi:hypothetical protein
VDPGGAVGTGVVVASGTCTAVGDGVGDGVVDGVRLGRSVGRGPSVREGGGVGEAASVVVCDGAGFSGGSGSANIASTATLRTSKTSSKTISSVLP